MKEAILQRLTELAEPGYQKFVAKLIPTLEPERILGVRSPALKKLAQDLAKAGPDHYHDFLLDLPHRYLEENNLHMLLISKEKDFATALAETERFLPYIDNWATCDGSLPKVFAKHKEELLPKIWEWLESDRIYTIRYAMGLLMSLYLAEDFAFEQAERVATLYSEEYYVRMMQAWYMATALAKQYEAVIPLLENQRMERWTHNKAIQKAVESYRIPAETKTYLKSLRRGRSA